MSESDTEKKFGQILLGKIVHFVSGYSDGKLHLYQITKSYRDCFGRVIWVDLHALHEDILSHYSRHDSVQIYWIKKLNKELIEGLELESKLQQ